MDTETATPLEAPVEAPSDNSDALAKFLEEDDEPTQAQPEADGQSPEGEPAPEGEAQKAEEAKTEEAPPVEDLKYKVKVRGEELEVPLSELLNGYSRTEDYKAKTAEVAELRRQTETEYADKLEQQLQQFVALDPVLAQAQNIDWVAFARADPAAYTQFKAEYDARVQMFTSAAREVEQIKAADQQRQAEATQEYLKGESEALLKAMPELADQKVMQEFAHGTANYLRSIGATDAEIAALDDHRSYLIIDKARKWDALQNAKTTAQTKKTGPAAQPTLKPQAAESPRAPKKPSPNASDEAKRNWVLAQLDAE
mgnify:CR=1 FL=1